MAALNRVYGYSEMKNVLENLNLLPLLDHYKQEGLLNLENSDVDLESPECLRSQLVKNDINKISVSSSNELQDSLVEFQNTHSCLCSLELKINGSLHNFIHTSKKLNDAMNMKEFNIPPKTIEIEDTDNDSQFIHDSPSIKEVVESAGKVKTLSNEIKNSQKELGRLKEKLNHFKTLPCDENEIKKMIDEAKKKVSELKSHMYSTCQEPFKS